MRIVVTLSSLVLLQLLTACSASESTSAQSAALHPKVAAVAISDPFIEGFWDTDTAVGALSNCNEQCWANVITIFSATTGASDEIGIVRRSQGNAPSPIQWSEKAFPGFTPPGHLPHVAWMGHDPDGGSSEYDPTFVAAMTMTTQNVDDTVALSVTNLAGQVWSPVQLVTDPLVNPDYYISSIQIATEPENGPAPLKDARHFYIAFSVSDRHGPTVDYHIWKFHIVPGTPNAVRDFELPPIGSLYDGSLNARRMNVIANQAQDGTPYVAVVASSQSTANFTHCPNSQWSKVDWQLFWFNPNGNFWQASTVDSDPQTPFCGSSGPASNMMQNNTTPAMSRGNDGSVLFAYPKETTHGLRVNVFQTPAVMDTEVTDLGTEDGFGCSCPGGLDNQGHCGNWVISPVCALKFGACGSEGHCVVSGGFPLYWPSSQYGHVWLEPEGEQMMDSILPAMPRDYFLHAVTWLDNRDDAAGTFGAVYGVDTDLPTIDHFGAATSQVGFVPMVSGIHNRATYMSLNTWSGSSFFWGASFGANKLWLQYADQL